MFLLVSITLMNWKATLIKRFVKRIYIVELQHYNRIQIDVREAQRNFLNLIMYDHIQFKIMLHQDVCS
jgi:hypothetical protein